MKGATLVVVVIHDRGPSTREGKRISSEGKTLKSIFPIKEYFLCGMLFALLLVLCKDSRGFSGEVATARNIDLRLVLMFLFTTEKDFLDKNLVLSCFFFSCK